MADEMTLEQWSAGLADAVERASSSVLAVYGRRRLPASGVAWSADGLVVTADHVLQRDEELRVGLPGSEDVVPATLLGRDPGSDLAVLRVEGLTLTPPDSAPEASARVGSLVLAIGRPGAAVQASLGVVSAVGGPWRTASGTPMTGHLLSDATMLPGFSGGALIDPAGRVLGLNTSGLRAGGGVTIPLAALRPVVEALAEHGTVRRAYLGIGSQRAALPEGLAAKVGGQESALLIVHVQPGSAADAAGLLVGDLLVALAGEPVAETEDLQSRLRQEHIGQQITARVLRGGEPMDVPITPGERPSRADGRRRGR